MSNQHHKRADKVVVKFKEVIGQSVCTQISEAHFQDLALLIRDAITDEVLFVAERMEKIIKDVRIETDLHELGI